MDVPISQVVYTGMLNTQGGYQSDCTVTRLEEEKYDQQANNHSETTTYLLTL